MKGCDIYLALKKVCYKLYKDLQFLSILTHYWKDFSIDFVTGLPFLVDYKVTTMMWF